mgnify:CR=1 FL=1
MTAGLMQTPPLQIIDILKFAASAHGRREIVSRLVDEPLWRYTYADCLRRTAQAANALKRLGVNAGVFFDLNVTNPNGLTITALDVNSSSAVGTAWQVRHWPAGTSVPSGRVGACSTAPSSRPRWQLLQVPVRQLWGSQ